ncbi:hypothetical protein [Streptomyces sp. NPDC051173]|uniref:hypothetical protein n=1 Tax=Streptomyces sp. NPDC051173 TaxID=3155164 RepID=UPI00344B3471
MTPEVGSFVVDTRRGAIGEVMGHEGPRLQLRPASGGREWEAEPDDVRPATEAEKLTAKVRAANSGSRWGK